MFFQDMQETKYKVEPIDEILKDTWTMDSKECRLFMNQGLRMGDSLGEEYHTTCIHIGRYILRKK